MHNEKDIQIDINSRHSFIHLGSLDSFDITEGGKSAGRKILEYLDTGKLVLLKEAQHIYEELIPNENFGGEYTALEWLCKYCLAPEDVQAEYLRTSIRAMVRLTSGLTGKISSTRSI